MQGNSFTVTILALMAALVVGGLMNAFSNTDVLHAWGNLFSDPGHAIAPAWDTAIGAYVALFEGSIFNPHTVSALFQQASFSTAIHDGYLSAVFNPLSETCVQATPLILAGLAVALPYQAGMFNIGGQSQFIGGMIVATYLGYGVSLPVVIHVWSACSAVSWAARRSAGWSASSRPGPARTRSSPPSCSTTSWRTCCPTCCPITYLLQARHTGNPLSASHRGRRAPAAAVRPHLRINAGFLVALACAAGIWWLLTRTTTGSSSAASARTPARRGWRA